ncbi:LacI family DNA-binding transcriptional regulator [Nonomuraea typhae]|uniref:LacI family DNA-binding transcriptional regulator n=1 Tax=Nonomuraea typhae TaxID=2603600 RepID=UPI0012F77EC5|nr:LacI family DNA-binding transcriptional regulator [Nonomuraea typhae]
MPNRIADVARFAGVSPTTVRRVLYGRPGTARATRDAVLTALDVLGIERPAALREQRHGLVGLVIPDLQNPIFPAFAEVLVAALVRQGLSAVLCTRTADGVSEANYLEMLLKQDLMGIVFVGSSFADAGAAHGRELREREVPIVLINAADENPGVPRVRVDDALAVEQSLAHLTALGHERIGLIAGPAGHVPSARKLGAFAQARPGDWRRLVAHTIFSVEGGTSAGARLLDEGVTAVICASDALAMGAVRAARRRGLDVPGGLSVVGFDDSLYMGFTDPPLTTIRQPVQVMGAAAMAALTAQIRGHAVNADEILCAPELIVRASTAPPIC